MTLESEFWTACSVLGVSNYTSIEFWNRTYKKLRGIGSWENTKRAAVEAELKKIEVIMSSSLP